MLVHSSSSFTVRELIHMYNESGTPCVHFSPNLDVINKVQFSLF